MEKPKIDKKISESRKIDNEQVNKQVSTGAYKKRGSIKASNSLRSTDNGKNILTFFFLQVSIKKNSTSEPPSNLSKLRNSHLGKSAPSLNAKSLKDTEGCVLLRKVNQQSAIRSPAVHRIR